MKTEFYMVIETEEENQAKYFPYAKKEDAMSHFFECAGRIMFLDVYDGRHTDSFTFENAWVKFSEKEGDELIAYFGGREYEDQVEVRRFQIEIPDPPQTA